MLLSFVGKHPYLCFLLSHSTDHCLIRKIVNEHMVTAKQKKLNYCMHTIYMLHENFFIGGLSQILFTVT